jgi:hypothetical protein
VIEAAVLRDVLAYLRYRNILHARVNAGRKGGVRLAPAGFPDIVAEYRGRFIGIECKCPDGVLSPEQIVTLMRIRDDGGIAVVARSVADVAEALK